MPTLRTLMLKTQYRRSEHDLARDFYARCLPASTAYDRAVGFFSSDVFAACPGAFADFFARGGRMRVVCSHVFTESDLLRLREGLVERPALVKEDRLGLLRGNPSEVRGRLGRVVPWLVARDLLSVQVAVVEGARGTELYHEKLGCFVDGEDAVAFSGSANETYHALQRHFEVVDVFRTWHNDERRRAEQKRSDFKALWVNETDRLRVVPFEVAAREGLLRVNQPHNSPEAVRLSVEGMSAVDSALLPGLGEVLHLPAHVRLYDHQKRAVRAWLEARGRGVFEMATGSGKTITALAAATKLYELVGGPFVIVVLCPYLHLVDQWVEEAKAFGLDPVACARGRSAWEGALRARLYRARTGDRPVTSAVVSNDTFRSAPFQTLLRGLDVALLLIGDEMHNLGARGLQQRLPERATYRLGLSATPQRRYDPEGTASLFQYFGATVAHYTLADALRDGVLTPYRYVPHLVDLTEEELGEYEALTKRIARAMGGEGEDNPALEQLLIKRARLTASAANKLPLLRRLIEPLRNTKHTLVYCGDGRVEVGESDEEERQVRAVTRALGADLGMRVATYTAETPPDRRRQLQRDFANGGVQALVAIRCLDEGVDIPATQRAFILASVTDPRQYVQRRGRVLRRAPGKELAEVHDFLVAPPEEHQDPASPYYQTTRRLFGRELERALEFAELAVNGPEAMGRLLDVRDRLQLLSVGSGADG